VARHPFDLWAFVFGLVITGLAVAYVVGAYTDIRLDPRLTLPLVLVGLGAVGLAASLVAQRRSDRRVQG
jgi:hypothetical protein